MVTRQEAENQTDRCFMYHLGAFIGTIALLAAFDRRAIPAVTGVWGLGVAAHGAFLYGCRDTREALVRTTASMMEDLRHAPPERKMASRSEETMAIPSAAPFH